MDSPPALVCAGRPVDDHGRPAGDPCGRTFSGESVGVWEQAAPGTVLLCTDLRWPTREEQAGQARAAGWSVAGPPMCPTCRTPDPAISRGLTTQREQ